MSDDERQPPGPGGGSPGGEDVGSVGEEAAKLFSALAGWARDQGTDYAGTAAGAATAFGEALHNVNEHVATGAPECKYCPICQVISAVRATSPEVKAHLAVAASSLMHAAAGLMATQVPEDSRGPRVEKINLDDAWDEDS